VKILVTGYTTRMFNSSRVQRDYITFSYLLVKILKDMGFEVHHCKVEIGDNLSQYDFAFCGVAPLHSMTSGRVPETHYVMNRMEYKHAVYADDWSFCGYGDSIRGALRDWDKYLKYKNFPYATEYLEDTRISLDLMVNFDESTNAKVLAPMFNWGDHEFLIRGNYKARLVTIDPSAWVTYPTIDIPPVSEKKKQWVMAALSDHSPWVKRQRFSLPVTYIGNKRMGNGVVLSEAKTIQLFANSFGVLSCKYPSAGSGWWRTRYLNAAWAESLVYCDPKDQEIMGEAYQGTPQQMESINEETYYYWVEGQNQWLNSNLASREQVYSIINDLLRRN